MELDKIRDLIRKSGRIVVLTGAGISAESGIPTFRGAGGLWRTYRAEDLATPDAFARDPVLVWEWYESRRAFVAKAEPNAGHRAITEMQKGRQQFTVVTQNVDNLHERAGSEGVLHLHGSIWTLRCIDCGAEAEDLRVPLPELPPSCACGGMLRPGVVWFGEALPHDLWLAAEQAVSNADIVLVVGTSAVVYPAASLIPYGIRRGATVIEINPEETAYSADTHFSLRGTAGEILPQLL